MDSYLYREYAYSPKGVAVYGRVSGHKYKRIGIVATQMGKQIVSPLQYGGTMDSGLFEHRFRACLLPALSAASVIVMETLPFTEKSSLFLPLAEKAGHRLIFLPLYSSELNPIEHFWSWLKRQLRKILPLHHSFDKAMCHAFNVR